MAVIQAQSSGSPLIGSPIVYPILAGSFSNTTFHRVKLQVVAGLQGGNYVTIEMSSPADEGETLQFDISSALRAVADKYEYTPEPPERYPYISYYMIAWDEYMQNGIIHTSTKDYLPDEGPAKPFRALMGAYSDLERLLAGENKQTLKFTRKPATSPEIVRVGDKFIRPADMSAHSGNIVQGPQSVVYTIAQDGMQTQGGAMLYALPANTIDCYQIRFINGLGCMESLTVHALRESESNITTDQQTRAIQESFNVFSRGIAVKSNDYETWKMTSGPVDETWQSWFIHEFLMARWTWINIRTSENPLWIPCHVIPEETVPAVNRTKGSMLEVQFSLQLDITGSPLSAIAI